MILIFIASGSVLLCYLGCRTTPGSGLENDQAGRERERVAALEREKKKAAARPGIWEVEVDLKEVNVDEEVEDGWTDKYKSDKVVDPEWNVRTQRLSLGSDIVFGTDE
jgi:hypothetical protein